MPAEIACIPPPGVVRRLLLPGALHALGVAILVGLGFWQIERMGAKQRLIARVEAGTERRCPGPAAGGRMGGA